MSKCGIAALCLLKFKMIEYLTSTFIIRYSIFAFSEFLFRLDWPLFRPAAALNTDPPAAENLNHMLSLTAMGAKWQLPNGAKRQSPNSENTRDWQR
jgi:hypothetical protein